MNAGRNGERRELDLTKIDEYDELDYEDLCVGCGHHDRCHTGGSIDYDKIDKCAQEINEQVHGKPKREPLPKEKVCFT